MKVYLVMYDEGGGNKRIRGIFSTKQKADDCVGPQDMRKTIPCDCCGQQKPNPAYSELNKWRQDLFVKEWVVQ